MADSLLVKIDRREESVTREGSRTLDDLVGIIVKRLVPLNRFVSRLVVNGEDLTEQNQSRLASMTAADVKEIEIVTEPVSDAVVGALDRATDYLDRLGEGIRLVVEKYRTGEETGAHQLLAECLQGLIWFVGFASNIKVALHLNYDEEYFQGETLTTKQDRLYEYIRELEKAQKNMDIVYMADLLEYEIEPILKNWIEVFPALRGRAGAFTPAGAKKPSTA